MERRRKGQGMTACSWTLAFRCEAMMAYAGRRYIIDALSAHWSYITISSWLAELTARDDKFKIVELNPTQVGCKPHESLLTALEYLRCFRLP
jgi:hypothetical protein